LAKEEESMKSFKRIGWAAVALAVLLSGGCSRPILKESAIPSKDVKDRYMRIKRVAVFPFENYTESKDVDKTIDALLLPALRDLRQAGVPIFDEIEDTRFVRDSMKKLKITATDILEKEVLKKLSDELNVQAIICGKVVAFGKGKEKDAASQVSMDIAMVEPSTGIILWSGNVSTYGGLTVGKIFGVTEGKTDIEVARDAVRYLTVSLRDEVARARDRERKGILSEIRTEQDKEAARLKDLKGETTKLQEQVDKAKAEAVEITEKAKKDADALKSDLELEKAAIEAQKTKTDQEKQDLDQEKLKIEMERKKNEEESRRLQEEKKAVEELKRMTESSGKVTETAPAAAPAEAAPAAPAAPAESAPAAAPAEAAPAAPAESAPAAAPAEAAPAAPAESAPAAAPAEAAPAAPAESAPAAPAEAPPAPPAESAPAAPAEAPPAAPAQ
jgi:hypothetical protein